MNNKELAEKINDSFRYSQGTFDEDTERIKRILDEHLGKETFTKMDLDFAVTCNCACGGGGPNDKHSCPACLLYHQLMGKIRDRGDEHTKESERGLVCVYCGEGFGYVGKKPTEAELKRAVDHEAQCPKNPHLAKLAEAMSIVRRLAAVEETVKSGDFTVDSMEKFFIELIEKARRLVEREKGTGE